MEITVIRHRDQCGPTYQGIAIHAPPGLHETVHALAEQHFSKDRPVLEIGAGSGALSQRLTDSGFTVTPVDLDGSDWKLPLTLIEADLNRPDWQERLGQQEYAQIIAVEVIEHLENPSKFFRDIAALLPAGGTLILTTPNVLSFHSVLAAFKRGVFAFFSADDCISSGHISILPWWLLTHLAGQAGLTPVSCTSVCELPMGAFKTRLVNLITRLRRFVYRPQDVACPEGLNTVMVFRKTSV